MLVDTEQIHSRAFEQVLGEMGIVPRKTEHGTVHIAGVPTHAVFETLKNEYEFDGDVHALTKQKQAATLDILQQGGVELMPGALALLNDLRLHRIPMAVATSAKRNRLDLILRTLDIAPYFLATISADDVEHIKPAPEPYLKAAGLLGVAASECVVFEDTPAGVQAGKAAGATVIAVPNVYTRRMDFSAADKIVPSLEAVSYATIW